MLTEPGRVYPARQRSQRRSGGMRLYVSYSVHLEAFQRQPLVELLVLHMKTDLVSTLLAELNFSNIDTRDTAHLCLNFARGAAAFFLDRKRNFGLFDRVSVT